MKQAAQMLRVAAKELAMKETELNDNTNKAAALRTAMAQPDVSRAKENDAAIGLTMKSTTKDGFDRLLPTLL